jgi:glucose-1-phosphate thymidylyltransferase
MKGIILAGGAGSRLYPMSKVITKQLQPIYDKPMIYYPLSILMLSNISEILLITTIEDQPRFQRLLKDGSHLGLNIQYIIQDEPKGISEAFLLGEEFIDNDDVTLILGDNFFHGDMSFLRNAYKRFAERETKASASIFGYFVNNPSAYGVINFKENNQIDCIEEKPALPKSNYAIPGLYIFDGSVSKRAKTLKPSKRGELEIVDLINTYLEEESLTVELINRGVAWLDTGTPRNLHEASAYINAIEERQGLKVACLEEIAYRMKFISEKEFDNILENTPNCPYLDYLKLIKRFI